jgi:hypothetical protein
VPSTTLTTIRQRLLRELDLGVLVPAGKVDSIAATSVTAADVMRNSRWTSGHFSQREAVIYRPGSATAADNIRYAGDLNNATGALSHTGANYSDTTSTSEAVELWYDSVRPDLEVLDAINRALEFVHFSTFIPISHGGDLDYDMSASTDTNWTNVGSPSTSAKSVTARRTPYGLRSYELLNNGVANEGTQSATLGMGSERSIRGFAIASVNVGGASFQLYDVTNSGTTGLHDAVTSSQEEPVMLVQEWQNVPSTTREIAARLLGTTTTSHVFWNGLWLYKQDNLRVNLPSFLNEGFKTSSIFQGRPRFAVENHVYDAQSLDMIELHENKDYRYLYDHHNDANPYAIMVNGPEAYDWPLFVEARLPYSHQGTLALEADTTNCPLHLLMPILKIRVLNDIYLPRNPSNPVWLAKLAEANLEWQAVNSARPIKSVARKPYFGGVRI